MANHSEPGSAISLGQDSATSMHGGQLDSASHVILKLLVKAAGAAEADSRRALETAQQLSTQLHAARNRIGELEAEVQLYREKSERAEDWLKKISADIETRLISEPQEHRRQSSRL
jgi:predicted  nucleic acid-binding Zn-ribbon protein